MTTRKLRDVLSVLRKLPLLAAILPTMGNAQITEPPNLAEMPRSYLCSRAKSPVVIDGRIDDPAWDAAQWTEQFVDIQGTSMPAPRFGTRAKMLWDDDYFYIAGEIEEPNVWATLRQRDTVIFYDNDFEVFIDPNGDNLEYIEMEMNAFNTVWDLLLPVPYRDGGHGENSFNLEGLKTAVAVHGTINDPRDRDTGWTVEIAIPWSAFAKYAHRDLPPHVGDQWRLNFSRVEWQVTVQDGVYRKVPNTPEDNWVWSPQGVIDMHRPERWGYVQFTRTPDAKLRTDPSWPARVFLHRVYYAERSFQERFGRWAGTFDELELKVPPEFVDRPLIEATSQGYTATVSIRLPDGSVERWHIRQDSRIWSD